MGLDTVFRIRVYPWSVFRTNRTADYADYADDADEDRTPVFRIREIRVVLRRKEPRMTRMRTDIGFRIRVIRVIRGQSKPGSENRFCDWRAWGTSPLHHRGSLAL
jgi:hypothetical protein